MSKPSTTHNSKKIPASPRAKTSASPWTPPQVSSARTAGTCSPMTQALVYVAMFLLIVGIGIASRLWLVDWPNFKPLAALILFGGFFFKRTWIPILACVLVLAISDLQLGVYNWQMAMSVYASFALSCGLGFWVRRSLETQQADRILPSIGFGQVGRFAAASLLMSTAFFLLTNGAVWCLGWYPQTGEGLLACYSAGIPFYRATLLGDLFFTSVTIASYCLFGLLCNRFLIASEIRSAATTG